MTFRPKLRLGVIYGKESIELFKYANKNQLNTITSGISGAHREHQVAKNYYVSGLKPVNFEFYIGPAYEQEKIRDRLGCGVVKMNIDNDSQPTFLEGIFDCYYFKNEYMHDQFESPEGDWKPNKKFYTLRVRLHEDDKTFRNQLKQAFKDQNSINCNAIRR